MVLRKKDLNCTHWRKKFVKRSMIYHTRIHPSRKWSKCLSTLPEFHKGQSISTYFCCSSLPFTKKTPQLISSLGTKKGGGGVVNTKLGQKGVLVLWSLCCRGREEWQGLKQATLQESAWPDHLKWKGTQAFCNLHGTGP